MPARLDIGAYQEDGRITKHSISDNDLSIYTERIVRASLNNLYRVPKGYREAIHQIRLDGSFESRSEASSIIRNLIDDRIGASDRFQLFDPHCLAPLVLNRLAWRQTEIIKVVTGKDNLVSANGNAQVWQHAISKFCLLDYFLARRLDASITFLLEIAEETETAVQNGLLSSSNLAFRFDLGDFHNDNRSTMEVVDLEKSLSLYYKPRTPNLEKGMGDLLAETSTYSNLRIPIVIGGKYGHWATGVGPQVVNDSDDSLGAIAQFIHFCMTFNLTDMHVDNYIKNTGNIYIVDGETFFSSRPRFVSDRDQRTYGEVYDVYATTAIANEFDRQGVPIDGTGIQGLLAKERFSSADIQKIIDLLKSMNKETGLERSLDLAASFLNHCNLRYLHRDTKAYFWMLDILAHPHSFLNKDTLIESAKIVFSNLANADEATTQTVAQSELRQLLDGDVPYFYRTFGSTDLHDPKITLAPNYFDQSRLEKIEKKFEDRLAHEHVNMAKLKFSLELESNNGVIPVEKQSNDPVTALTEILRSELLLRDDKLPFWNGMTAAQDGNTVRISETWPLDFYGGMLGIVGALKVLENDRQTLDNDLKLSVIDEYVSKKVDDTSNKIGTLTDILRYFWMGESNSEIHLETVASILRKAVSIKTKNENEFDFLSGWAGFFSLVSSWSVGSTVLREELGSQPFHEEFMASISDYVRFLSQWTEENPSLATLPDADDGRRFGLAHGLAGHLQALYDLINASFFQDINLPLRQSLSAAQTAISKRVERRIENNSPDDNDMRWCNGKLGELLTVVQTTDNDRLVTYAAEWAVQKQGLQFERSHFCCGEAGFLYFQYILTTKPKLNPSLRNEVRKQMHARTQQMSDRIKDQNLAFGLGFDNFAANPSLFTGISGIALVLNLVNSNLKPENARGPWLNTIPELLA